VDGFESAAAPKQVFVLTLEDQWGVGANQHGTSTHTTDWSRTSLLVDGNITAHDNRISAIPRLALDPVDTVEKSSGGTVTSVLVVDTLDVVITSRGKEVHEESLGSLGLVNQGFSSNIETTNRVGVDVVLLEER
jgi:hypothetical protein